MNPAIEKLGILVRVRRRERDRREQALLARRREHERCGAELRRRQALLVAAQGRHQAALTARLRAPGDLLVADYLQCEQTTLRTLGEDERQAGQDLDRAEEDLTQARGEHHRAQLRLEVLRDELARVNREEQRRLARKQENARPETIPASAVGIW